MRIQRFRRWIDCIRSFDTARLENTGQLTTSSFEYDPDEVLFGNRSYLQEPHEDYWDPACVVTPEILKKPQLRRLDVQNDVIDRGFTAELSSLASASRSNRNTRLAAVTTEQSTIHQLANSGRWFKASLKDQETQKWIEEVIETGEDVYMVVGYQTMIDKRALGDTTRSKEFQGQVQLPVSEAASVSTDAVVMFDDLADPGLDIQRHSLRKQFVAASERMYAVQYRKVQFKWYSSRDLNRAALEKGSRWKVHGITRAGGRNK